MPRFTPRDSPTQAPHPTPTPGSTDDSGLKDRAAASAVSGAAPAVAPKPEDEDMNRTFLGPISQKYELPTKRASAPRDWSYLAELGLQGAAALAAVYLLFHSDVGYLLGITRRRNKKTGGQG